MTLSKNAINTIHQYKNLNIGGKSITTPYFINKINKVRAGLKVLVGKGTPKEIEDEANLIALRKKINLSKLTDEQIIDFLIQNNIGIDCSGFVYHVINAQTRELKQKSLSSFLNYKHKNPIRAFITKLRPAENTSVSVLFDEKNTTSINIQDAQTGDIIIMMGTGTNHDLNHILLITDRKESKNKKLKSLQYIHSLKWKSDKALNHGVREGKIIFDKANKPLDKQSFEEQGKTGKENETLWRVKTAEKIKIGRGKWNV